ncbi:SWIM zinc finger family protein [Paenibacillus radicis (ex Gao et al. 2016)]|uniref:SWIM-type domain-containing protein n=1 Tax=Paenibacillus radicis (ex Gao et al. 2016) TaxID=1737354 RepID=A0A917LZI4_9BACL|nr:SWIM zinc finger family protein [Paenibacillus radicis (ex Gao et al. 2016)]GGG67568.1 hypothetical protein GCM10010918_22740 [Paenibacillus radicis (ex Gao et al. 2016)]
MIGIKLSQIEDRIDLIILERGEAYRENGHILSIKEVKPRVYEAEVEGTELYDVEIQLDSRGEVNHTLCECPYDKGPICKHAAAVLLEIRDEFFNKEKAQSFPKNKPVSKKTIADQLSNLSKDELITMLVHFSDEIKEVKQALSLKFIDADSKEGLNQYKKVIRASIKQYSDRHGFVPYRNVYPSIAGASKILEKAEEQLESRHHLRAAEISFCVMHEMVNLLQSCDDSDGYVGDLIKECLNAIHLAASQIGSAKDSPALFQLLLKEVLHEGLEGWNEWQLSLMESATCLITNVAEKDSWFKLLERLESHERNQSSYSSYFTEEAAKLRYQVIERLEGDSQALSFLQDHLHITAFRKMAIETAIKNLQFDKALELVEQGERQDTSKGYRGLVNEWKRYRYEIYELTHQVGHQIELAKEFVRSGEHSYYLRLKELYSKDEWEAGYEGLLDELEHNSDSDWATSSLYTRILVEENQTLRLLKYVDKRKQTLIHYYPHLISEHAEEVFLLFTQFISEETAQASNRNQYRKVCGIIRHLIKAGGGEHAKRIIEQLCVTYQNRPALIDELQKIKRI